MEPVREEALPQCVVFVEPLAREYIVIFFNTHELEARQIQHIEAKPLREREGTVS